MNLVIVGYRAVGKTTIARVLAERLGWPCVVTDERVVERAGRSIADIVAADGWPAFRALERAVVREVSAGDEQVVDTGGGVVLDPENVADLRRNGLLVWLRAPVGLVEERLAQPTDRPPLTAGSDTKTETRAVLRERTPLYAAAAHGTIDVEGRTADEIAAEILRTTGLGTR